MKNLTTIIAAIFLLTSLTTAQNYSLSFDGVDDYVEVIDLSQHVVETNTTLMGWFKSTSNGLPNIYLEGIFGFRNYPSLDANYFALMNWTGWVGVPKIECTYYDTPANITLTPDDNTWYHIALVYGDEVFSTYLNGVLQASGSSSNMISNSSVDLLIGDNIVNGNHFFQGYIDDISLWSVALSQENIQSYLSSELNGNETGLVGYWNFNEGTGTTLTDQTSNDNDGTIDGATWSDDVPLVGTTDIHLSGDIGGLTLTPDEEWLVLDSVWVEDGDTLTILPGTIIKFTPGIDAYMLIKRGGYIHAQGTEDDPILFTSASEDPKSDDWLAFQILGKGPGQDPFWEVQDDHNAGVLQYINIEYSQYGFGLVNIGSGTDVSFITHSFSGTGYYILGGNAPFHNLAAVGIWGTAFYISGGYTSVLNEIFINGAERGISVRNTHGAYWDYDEQVDPDIEPRTYPTISQLTMTNVQGLTLEFRNGGVGEVNNTIIYDYGWDWGGIRVSGSSGHVIDQITIDNIQHNRSHDYGLTNNSLAEQVVTNIVDYVDPVFDGFVPTNSDDRGAMLGGDWLSTWGHTLELSDIAHVFLTWPGSSCILGDTVTTDLAIGLSQGNELSSADIQVSYDITFFDLISVAKAPGFYEDDENVSLVYNDVNGIVNISLAASWPLNTDDNYKAVRFGFVVQESLADTTVLFDIPSVSINEDDYFYTDFSGYTDIDILTQSLGDVSLNGEISSYDASLILQYLVGNTELSTIQLWNGDVSGLEGTTAYDASLIQQYMVGLIDIFPADTGSFSAPASGTITMEDQEIFAGMQVAIPLLLTGGDDILSFEKSVVYNTDHLTFIEVEWSNLLGEFIIVTNDQDGELKFAGSGSLPDGEEGVFATFHFVVNEDFEENETAVTVQRSRWNEESILTDATSATLTKSLGTGDEKLLPENFALHQNYPNPFNPVTTLRYDLPENSLVNIIIYDLLGRQVKTLVNQTQDAGFKSIIWDATNDYGKPVSAGVYLYKIQAGDFVQTNKMVLLK